MVSTVAILFSFSQLAVPSLAFNPDPVHPAEAVLVTEAPQYPPPTRIIDKRNLISDAKSYANSLLDGAASYVSEGVGDLLLGLPTGEAVLESAGITEDDLGPEQSALAIPGYGNWTNSGWNLRVHGNIYKQPDISDETINELADVFLIDTTVEELPPSQASQAVNVTRSIFVLQQGDVNVTVDVESAPSAGSDGESGGGGGVTPPGGDQRVDLPFPTTDQGDYDVFVPISGEGLADGNGTGPPQLINTYVTGSPAGNATSYLVHTEGLTVISDIDDILRVTKIFDPKEGLLNTFARPFDAFMNMPDIFANWSKTMPDTHFHYLTTTPEQVTRNYMDFIYKTYPGGSFDTRPLNFSDISATLSIRKFLLDKIFQTYPERKFVLVADTTNSDVMKAYPAMANEYPGQVQCIFLRNTTATDSSNKFPYDTSGFEGLDQEMYMFFVVPDDLTNLDVANGECYNSSIPQNLTFGLQGLPFGIGEDDDEEDAGSFIRVAESRVAMLTSLVLACVGAIVFS